MTQFHGMNLLTMAILKHLSLAAMFNTSASLNNRFFTYSSSLTIVVCFSFLLCFSFLTFSSAIFLFFFHNLFFFYNLFSLSWRGGALVGKCVSY